MSLEETVHKMTQDTALVYGLEDRGVIAPGYKADLNVIDYDQLRSTTRRWSMTYRPGASASCSGPRAMSPPCAAVR